MEAVGNNWAMIAWTTNETSSSVVHYGTDRDSLTQTAQAPYSDTEGANHQTHRVKIGDLRPNTTYYFRIDSAGTQAQSAISRFTTK